MDSRKNTRCFDVFVACETAMKKGELVSKVSAKDKEYHFQDWFRKRLQAARISVDDGGRNSYPDFTLVHTPEGFELKALAYPGRVADFDCNSQVPTGYHNERTVFYVFGRYPDDRAKTESEYPLIDLVICHGDFLNADHSYIHKNKSFRGFGSYGDILVRDRKMYVAPTPFALLDGVTSLPTLVVPLGYKLDSRFRAVGSFGRVEADQIAVGYEFDLKKNELKPKLAKNPGAGRVHEFVAYRLKSASPKEVSLAQRPKLSESNDETDD